MAEHSSAVRLAGGVAGVLLLLAGCGDDSDTDPPRVDAPPGTFDAEVDVTDQSVTTRWSWSNESDREVLIVDAAPATAGNADDLDTAAAYVVGLSEDDVVQISQRLFAKDPDAEYESLPVAGVRRVPPGSTVRGRVVVERPLETTAPFDELADGEVDADESAGRVQYCLGVIASDDVRAFEKDGRLEVNQGQVDQQALLCSDPVPL